MKNYGHLFFAVLLLLSGCVYVSAQKINTPDSDVLNQKIQENRKLFETEPEAALSEIGNLIKEAEKIGKDSLELKLLATQAEYYYFLNSDFEQMLNSASVLEKKSKQYKNVLYEARAHKYKAQAYSFNELYDRSLDELKIGLDILNDSKSDNVYITMERANFYTAFANVYNLKGEYFSGIQSLLSSVKEHQKLTNPEWKRGTTFMDYANLGGAYLNVNLDSARVYAEKSLALKTEAEENHNLTYLNYIVLGRVNLEKENYNDALNYYKMAEKIQDNKHFINTKDLYENMSLVYEKLDSPQLASVYKNKLKELEFEISQSQNKSLRKIIQENQTDKSPRKLWIFIIFGLAILLAVFYLLYRRFAVARNTVFSNTALSPEKYNQLIQLLKQNDPTFLLAFEGEFPDFSRKLHEKSSELTNQEIELLAMTRLNLSNKEIAQYKFIQHKTVQNRRYMIRKKLNLPSETDLNKWIESL